MAWEKVKRQDYFEGSNRAFISISSSHFAFNTMLSRMAELGPEKRVTVYVDPENLKLGFEFHEDERPDSYALAWMSAAKKGDKRRSMQCASRGIIVQHPWIEGVAKLPKIKDRRFYPTKEGNLWVIQLCPSFEIKKARESGDIPSDATGIYRLLRESGEVVYIGRGKINSRVKQPDRQDWDFDRVEYSIVEDPDQQVKWESYWIDRFKEENKGKLPHYNKVSGAESG